MKRSVVVALVLLAAFSLQACASMKPVWQTVPAYPSRGQSVEQMSRDQSECEAWARQQTGYDPAMDTAKGAGVGGLIGAVVGAAAGAAIGAATGSPGTGAAIGAAAGGIGGIGVGGASGYTKSRESYERAYAACMSGRGYSTSGQMVPPVQVAPVTYVPEPQPVVAECPGKWVQEYGLRRHPSGNGMEYVPTGRWSCQPS